MNLNMTLTELSDSDLQEALDATGKGKPPVYKAPLRDILAFVGDKCGSVAVPYKDVNADAKNRATVLADVKNVLRKDAENGSHFARIAAVRAGTDADTVVIIVRAAEVAENVENVSK